MKVRPFITIILLSVIFTAKVRAQDIQERLLIPIRGDEQIPEFIVTAVEHSNQRTVKILVLPFAYATNPENITEAERTNILGLAELDRLKIERSCQQVAHTDKECEVLLAPILVRPDAEDPQISNYFTSDLTAIYILEGNYATTPQAIKGTPVETALGEAYQNGVIIAGNGMMLSEIMIGGYHTNSVSTDEMRFGAVDIQEGLSFGASGVIIEPRSMQENRFSRLLNAITLPDAPHLGIGLIANTGFFMPSGSRVEDVFGQYPVIVLDAETYHSADAVEYHLPHYLLSLRNVLVHMLSPGESFYDINARQHSNAAPASFTQRSFESLVLPESAGPLILGGDLSQSLNSNSIFTRFVNLSGGEKANIITIATGYSSQESAQQALEMYQAKINISIQPLNYPLDPSKASEALALSPDLTGIILIVGDQSPLQLEHLEPIKQAWVSGVPLLVDGAATAIAGAYYFAPGSKSDITTDLASNRLFQQSVDDLLPGLGLIDVTIEPNMMDQNRWDNLFSLAFNHPNLITIGLSKDTALEITEKGVLVLGENVIFTLDLRKASINLGTNKGFVIANGLLDAFAPGEYVQPKNADTSLAPVHVATPNLVTPTSSPTSSPTPLPTNTPAPKLKPTKTDGPPATRTLRPTITPPNVPPPADPGRANMMILFAILVVMVVLIGVWINRNRFD